MLRCATHDSLTHTQRLLQMRNSRLPKARDPILRPNMPELDCLRGIACLMVLFFHGFGNHFAGAGLSFPARWFVAATTFGWTGVNLFFVLSGFLITGILLDSKDSPRYYSRFYYRRALRILPAYYGILLLVLVLVQTGTIDRPVSWQFLGASAIYLANIAPLFGISAQYGVLWSLAVEEHFYLLWPLFIRKLRIQGVTALATAICLLALGFRILAFATGHNPLDHYTWLVADGLAMGCLLAIAVRSFRQDRRCLHAIAAAAFLVTGLSYLIDRALGHAFAGGALHITSFNSFFLGLLATSLLLGSRFDIRSRALEFFGEISYGLYLVHLLCFDLYDHFSSRFLPSAENATGHFGLMAFRFGLSATLAVAIAILSRRYFEEPFLRLKDRLPAHSTTTPESELAVSTS